MKIEISGQIWYWRGPAPFYFVTIPSQQAAEIKAVESMVTYGWGMIPVTARIGETEWYTALWPKDGLYVLPLKSVVRTAEYLSEGDLVRATLTLELKHA